MFSFPSSSIPIARKKGSEYVQERIRLNVGEILIKLIMRLRREQPALLVIENTHGNMAEARPHSMTNMMPLEPMRLTKLNI